MFTFSMRIAEPAASLQFTAAPPYLRAIDALTGNRSRFSRQDKGSDPRYLRRRRTGMRVPTAHATSVIVRPVVFQRTPRTNGGLIHNPNSSNVKPRPSPYSKAIHDL